jgi:hypothetical protein
MKELGTFLAAQAALTAIIVSYVAIKTAGDDDDEKEKMRKDTWGRVGNNKLSFTFNVLSPDFMSLRVGEKSYSFLLGYDQAIKTTMQSYMGFKYDKDGLPIATDDPFTEATRTNVWTKFFFNKTAPITNTFIRKGEEDWATDSRGKALDLVTPMFLNAGYDVYNYEQENIDAKTKSAFEGYANTVGDIVMLNFGIPVEIDQEMKKLSKEEVDEKINKAIKTRDFSGIPRAIWLRYRDQFIEKPAKTFEEKQAAREAAQLRRDLEEQYLGIEHKNKFRGTGRRTSSFGKGFQKGSGIGQGFPKKGF